VAAGSVLERIRLGSINAGQSRHRKLIEKPKQKLEPE
jgi:hypothetical protein